MDGCAGGIARVHPAGDGLIQPLLCPRLTRLGRRPCTGMPLQCDSEEIDLGG